METKTVQRFKYSGTLLLCTQNLEVSGANSVLLNVLRAQLHSGNVVVLSPQEGGFREMFQELGAAVRIGTLRDLLASFTDIRFCICNTIMTAMEVLLLAEKKIPHCWILHEWWVGSTLKSMLSKRGMTHLNEEAIQKALSACHHTVYVCNAQKRLYGGREPSSVIPVGVPAPSQRFYDLLRTKEVGAPVTFLVLGIVCPRKNQLMAVKFFKAMGDMNARLLVVGARYQRKYEADYAEEVKKEIGDDKRIELIDCTTDVEQYYAQTDILLVVSLNEVTPMVIAEAMARGVPVIASDIAGIPDMVDSGVEGFLAPIDRSDLFVKHMRNLAENADLRKKMGKAGMRRYEAAFTMKAMAEAHQRLKMSISPPIVLVDMDGALVDWDGGFRRAWADRSPIKRNKYRIEDCVEPHMEKVAQELYHQQGFFRNLPPMESGIDAMDSMIQKGLEVRICTTPIVSSPYCAQEKFEWIRHHLGEHWTPRIVMTTDKTLIKGDILIDDKPRITGSQLPSWNHLLFHAEYNADVKDRPRLEHWKDWEGVINKLMPFTPLSRIDAPLVKDAPLSRGEETDGKETVTPPSSTRKMKRKRE